MTPSRWQQIKLIYEAVEALPVAERSAMLDRLCAEDTALHGEVRDLLSVESGSRFLGQIVREAAANVQAAETKLTGQILGNYRLDRLLGRGGMGDVYAAEDMRLHRQIALKMLPIFHTEDAMRIRRFQLESRAASALNHPGIVTIYDFGEVNGLHYLAMELVEGETLRQKIAGGSTPARDAISIGIQIASALAAAHRADIVHRDIKPENLMIRPDGYVKVLDFGLAKSREVRDSMPMTEPGLTTPGLITGTLRYMSPEQVRGLAIDARSDIFSFGVVIYELVAGRLPFESTSDADWIAGLLEREPLQIVAPSVPARLVTVIGRCLQKNCDDRYQTSQELHADLLQLKQELDSSSGLQIRAVPFRSGRGKLVYGIAGGMAVAAIAVGGFVYRRHLSESHWFQKTQFQKIATNSGLNSGAISPDGRYLAYSASTPDSQRSLNIRLLTAESGIELVPPDFVAFDGATFSPDGLYLYYISRDLRERRAAILYRIPVLGGTPEKVAIDNLSMLAFSPDGTRLAFRRPGALGGQSLVVSKLDGTDQREILNLTNDYSLYSFTWGPRDKDIFFTDSVRSDAALRSRIFAIDASAPGAQPRLMADAGAGLLLGLRVLPDGNGYLVLANDEKTGLPQISYLSPGGEKRAVTHDLNEYQTMTTTDDGHTILSAQFERTSQLFLLDLNHPEKAQALTEPYRRYDEPIWTRDGSLVAARIVGGHSNLWIANSDGTKARQVKAEQDAQYVQLNACTASPDFVFTEVLNGTSSIWKMRPGTGQAQRLTFGPHDASPICQPNDVVAFRRRASGGSQRLQVPLTGGGPGVLDSKFADETLSPDGTMTFRREIDAKTRESRIDVRSLKTEQIICTIPFSAGAVEWSPDSKGIAFVQTSNLHEIWYQPIDGQSRKQLATVGNNSIFAFSWSPDGRHLVYAMGRISSELVLIRDVS